MKESFRQAMGWLHTWAGLVVGWVLFFVFVTGTAGYFDTEIDRWMRPEAPPAPQGVPPAQLLEAGLQRLHAVAPGAGRWQIALPTDRNDPWLRIGWTPRPDASGRRSTNGNEQLDAEGRPFETRATGGGQRLYRMHYDLHYLPKLAGHWIVGVCSLLMLVALITGVIVHKKIFADFFTFRPGKGQRSWLDAHNLSSVVSLPFQLMITYSGLMFFAFTYLPLVLVAHYGPGEASRRQFQQELAADHAIAPGRPAGHVAPLVALAPLLVQAEQVFGAGRVRSIEVRHPGDAAARVIVRSVPAASPLRRGERLLFDGTTGQRLALPPAPDSAAQAVRDSFFGLHKGLYAGPLLRALYFLSGLLGTLMVASGLLLWTVKRRQRLEARGGAAAPGLRWVERLNLGTVIGLPVAIAAYFWANRLIPAGVAGRAEWEVHALFLVWALLLAHAAWRPLGQAWCQQLWLGAAAFGLLPLVNALTTERHLGRSLEAGDWPLAGFDLAMLGFGLAFAATALWMGRRARAAPATAGLPA